MGRGNGTRTARAFAPGHVTGFFVPDLTGTDPRGRGSTGAGLVLDLGVTVEVRYRPSAPTSLSLRSRPRVPLPISREVAQRLRAGAPGRLEVLLDHQLPIGQGLGMSAAGAVATGLAVADVLHLPPSKAWEIAHLADLFHGGGLGGVGGGLERRLWPGLPPIGKVVHRACPGALALYRAGPPIPSPSILSDPRWIAKIRTAGRRAERRFEQRPSLDSFLRESEGFTDAVGLASPAVAATLAAVRQRGRPAAQAMFGEVVFAWTSPPTATPRFRPPKGVRKIGTVRIGRHGARRLPTLSRR
jgi:pantoate kinase